MNLNGSDSDSLFEYCLWLGDSCLVLGHRLSEWCGHGPMLEEDIALTNIALDLIGQSRLFLSYAGEIEGKGRSEDNLAYLRDAHQYRNFLLAEQPNGDYAQTILRQFLVDAFQLKLYERLLNSADRQISAISSKTIKETRYHFRHSSEWLIRLGNGTEESHRRLQNGVDNLWKFTDDLFEKTGPDAFLLQKQIAADPALIITEWQEIVHDRFKESNLIVPEGNIFMYKGGRYGKHTEHLGYILAEMQFLQRAYPGVKW